MPPYTPNPDNYHEEIAIPDDGSEHVAASWGVAFEQLADNAAHLQRFEGGWYAFNWHAPVMVPGEFWEVPAGFQAAVVPSAASGGVPVLCAIGFDGATRRVLSPAGGSLSDVSSALLNGIAVSLAGGVYGGVPTLLATTVLGAGVLRSTDLGMTWSGVATTGTGLPDGIIAYWPARERWLIADASPGRLYYSDTLASWTAATGVASAPATPRKLACSDAAAVCVYRGSATQCAHSFDGSAWALLTLSAAAHDWRGVAHSALTDHWLAVASDGVGSVSEDGGSSWTEIAIPAGAQDVIAFKQWFVIVCTNVHGGLGASVAVSNDRGATWSEIMIDSATLPTAFDRLLPFGEDAIVACGRDEIDRMRVAFSLRAPSM